MRRPARSADPNTFATAPRCSSSFIDRHRPLVHAAPAERDDFGGRRRVELPQKEAGLGQDRLATAKRRRALAEQSARPGMLGIVPGEEGDQGAGIEQDSRRVHRPKPSRCSQLVDRSSGPFLNRSALRPARSSALCRRSSSVATRCRPLRRSSDSVRPVDRSADRARGGPSRRGAREHTSSSSPLWHTQEVVCYRRRFPGARHRHYLRSS
jgi:hypothetical protein